MKLSKLPFEVREVEASAALVKCGIPGIDWVINPYTGCRFGCSYCYASFMGRFVGKKISDWGEYVYIKVNVPELLEKEVLRKLKDKGRGVEVLMSSVTDPYQGLEVKYRLTRRCLGVLADYDFKGVLSILTKSKLVLRDVDILKKLERVVVGLTVTSADDEISRYFEKFAPPVSDRFEALEGLNRRGVNTYAFVGPLLPHFVANKSELEKVFRRLKEVGTRNVYVEHLNLSGYLRGRLLKEMQGVLPETLENFYASQSKKYREDLDKLVKSLVKKYRMNLLLDLVIFHREFQRRGKSKR